MTEPQHPDTPGSESHAAELRARIERLLGEDEREFGEFGVGDWLLCVFGAVIIPAAALWWFA